MCKKDSCDNCVTEEGIPEYFTGKNVLITGATGFLGKALVEKLLRSCPEIGTIYILVRPKRGKLLAERLANFTEDALYDRLKQEQPDVVIEKKVVPLAGDMLELKLGLNNEDRNLIKENVHLIFHVAATVRFNEPLKTSVILNVRGTREICQLALDSKKLQAYIHVSTAFANCDRSEATEILYPPLACWKKTIEIVEKSDHNVLAILSQKYIDNMPNTYCFTKNLAEHVVHDMCEGKIPTKIFRPSIVIGAIREPFAGWTDNLNGPSGLIIAFGKGIMRSVYSHDQYKPDYIPIDIVTKSLIVSAWDLASRSNVSEVEIMQCTSYSADWLRPSNAKVAKSVRFLHETPFNDVVWFPNPWTTTNLAENYIRTVLFMLLPSLLGDLGLRISGKEPRLLKIQKKMYIAQMAVRHFINNEWVYPNDNLLKLLQSIHTKDKKDWDYDFAHGDFDNYVRSLVMGLRRYVLHEADDTLPQAQKQLKRLFWADSILQIIFWGLIAFVVWNIGCSLLV